MEKNEIAEAVHEIDMMGEMLVTVVEKMQAIDATKPLNCLIARGSWFPSSPSIHTSGSGPCGTSWPDKVVAPASASKEGATSPLQALGAGLKAPL
jgi:hypothetical protein